MKDMSDSLVSRIIDKILPEIKKWRVAKQNPAAKRGQNRTLEPIYPIVYMDAMVFLV